MNFLKYKKLILILLILIFNLYYFNTKRLETLTIDNKLPDIVLENENQKLEAILNTIFPEEQTILYESPYRSYNKQPSYDVYELSDVFKFGKELEFEIIYNNNEYARPLYSSDWKNFYFRGWLDLDKKMSEAHHKLFVYYGGASNIFDFEGNLGFSENINVDYHRNINFLVYKFNVKQVIIYENQIVLVGTPSPAGAQIIAIQVNDILPKDMDTKEFLFQLSTPGGYELDFDYGYYYRSDYLKRIMEEEEGIVGAFSQTTTKSIQESLLKQNALLKKELSNYIPLEDNIRITEQVRNTLDIKNLITEGNPLNYNILYENFIYNRPIYDPLWKRYFDEGWAYLPTKMSENMRQLFILPENIDDQQNLLSRLGFHEKYNQASPEEISLLIYNFDPKKILLHNGLIGIVGMPVRNAVCIISFPRKDFIESRSNSIHLVTPDYYVLY